MVSIVALLAFSVQAQSTSPDAQEIGKLIDDLQKAIANGSSVDQLFSSNAHGRETGKIRALQTKGFLTFQIVDYTLKDLKMRDSRHATLPVTVKWSTRDEHASTTTTLEFEKDQTSWYFAKADFWEVSFFWFFPMILYGIGYGCGVVIMFWHSKRKNWVNPKKIVLWQVLAVLPFSLPLYFARTPWLKN